MKCDYSEISGNDFWRTWQLVGAVRKGDLRAGSVIDLKSKECMLTAGKRAQSIELFVTDADLIACLES